MTIQVYKETWHNEVRCHYTGRRDDYRPYFMPSSLYKFLRENNESPLLDIGCGENNLRLFFKNIVGIDHTIEAEHKCWPGEDEWYKLPNFRAGTAINSLHWGDIGSQVDLVMQKCDTMYITLNEHQDIEEYKTPEGWQKHGELLYHWHGQKPYQLDLIKKHLMSDQLYGYRFNGLDMVEDHAKDIYKRTVEKDPFFGVVRVVIKRG